MQTGKKKFHIRLGSARLKDFPKRFVISFWSF